MLDRDESALHGVQLSIEQRALLEDGDCCSLLLADIRDTPTIAEIFRTRAPQVVFHAAALKHLSLLERFPREALRTNVFATLDLLELARKAGVERFVNVSTDKAADPTSVLGYTKRISERLTADVAGPRPKASSSRCASGTCSGVEARCSTRSRRRSPPGDRSRSPIPT